MLLQDEVSTATRSGVKDGINLQEAVVEGIHVYFYYVGN